MREHQVGVINNTFSCIVSAFAKGSYVITLADVEAVEELIENDRSISIREHVKRYAKANKLPVFGKVPKAD